MAWAYYTQRFQDIRTDSDADYRLVGKYISDRLTDLGWGKTADTGQIDWSTATRPGAPTANTIGGYEIRVSSGPATDLYLKISYGLGYNVTTIGLWLATGEGSDGSGALTGDTATQVQMGSAVSTTSPYDSTVIVAGDADNFVIGATQEYTPANGFICGVQRSCDASGADTNDGWYTYGLGYAAAAFSSCQYVSYSTGAASRDSNSGFGIMSVPRTLSSTQAGLLFLPLFAQNGSAYAPMRDIMGQNWGNVYSRNTVQNYGSNREYFTVLGTSSSNVWGFAHPSTVHVGSRIS